ncbi:hypothetical protein GS3922_16820 [Geobacillus subterraneus]|uniref:Uncharacterized protein n=2 Tax=Geobacillus TaxID=129337 RepID=A0ABN4NKA8_9BACL|nr:hypothetical protein GS3922_16820 [Geobacillus subterraneus]KZS25536.1 hypothetical protein A5418_02375 [Geobacillus subterraneus]OXB85343.1 hypothetical protein B9L21_16995 [Geobacillus uzenensis]
MGKVGGRSFFAFGRFLALCEGLRFDINVTCSVTVYVLNEERLYEQADVQVKTGTVRSVYFPGLAIDMPELFR